MLLLDGNGSQEGIMVIRWNWVIGRVYYNYYGVGTQAEVLVNRWNLVTQRIMEISWNCFHRKVLW